MRPQGLSGLDAIDDGKKILSETRPLCSLTSIMGEKLIEKTPLSSIYVDFLSASKPASHAPIY